MSEANGTTVHDQFFQAYGGGGGRMGANRKNVVEEEVERNV